MVKWLVFTTMVMAYFGVAAFAQELRRGGGAPSVLVVYFSKTGNTRAVAEQIRARVGGDLFQVRTREPYPADYRDTTRIARAELDNDERPQLAETLSAADMDKYDVVFVGYPVWWGTLPMALFTFLEQHDFSGKTIVPFCTHGGSGLARGPADIERLCPGAAVRQGLAVRGDGTGGAQDDIADWLRRLGFVQ